MSNKARANSFCPLLDSGPPKGEVWVAVKPAKIPYTIIEMGTGDAGRNALNTAKALQQHKDTESAANRLSAAREAYMAGSGNLTEVLQDPSVSTDPHYSALDARREADLYPLEPTHTKLQRLAERLLKAAKHIWDSAQEP